MMYRRDRGDVLYVIQYKYYIDYYFIILHNLL